ncbi:unnamed protein product [Sphagnum jensenii]|uniref:Uncharacterized protein n=1 Tax=Sphagnum jensenii TaxID=128206 RepID=A0ABP0VKV4_9BRYO
MRVYFRQRHFRDVEEVVVVGGGGGGDGGCSTHSKTITQICARSLDQVVKERNKGRNEERNSFHLVLKQWIWSLGLCATLIELELSIVLNSLCLVWTGFGFEFSGMLCTFRLLSCFLSWGKGGT